MIINKHISTQDNFSLTRQLRQVGYFNKLLHVLQHSFDSNSNTANLINNNDELTQKYDRNRN